MADTPTTYNDDLELLRTAAVTAGIIAASYFRRALKTWTKENSSPVSEADIVLDKFLYSALTTARPDYGWLSEESADDLKRLTHKRVFIVDPIDGTRGFIKGEDSWTVSLAVVENGVPVAGGRAPGAAGSRARLHTRARLPVPRLSAGAGRDRQARCDSGPAWRAGLGYCRGRRG